jgi:hypothetical protein
MAVSDTDQKSEEGFNNWLESITFVDKNLKPLPVKLEKDVSDDPEGDRE